MAYPTRHRGLRAAVTAAALAMGLLLVPAAHAESSCGRGWTVETVLEGVGRLENLDSDGRGGFYLTGIGDGYLAHLDAAGRFEKLVTGLDQPAGVRVVGSSVYFLTGDGPFAAPGTLQRYDIDTGAVTVLLTGLNGPNGLLLLPDGDLLFSSLGVVNGPLTGISRYRPATGEHAPNWAPLPLSNGVALAPDGVSIFAGNLSSQVFRIPLAAPSTSTVVSGVPRLPIIPDDMEATRSGTLFVADHVDGAIFAIDTATGNGCSIVGGLLPPGPRTPPDGTTSVRIARDGDEWALYVTAMDGHLRRLRPPAGLDLTPADPRR